MQVNKEYEPETSLRDLFFDIMYHWRSCILVALIFALLFGGFRYAMNLKEIRSSSSIQVEEDAEINNAGNYQASADLYARLLASYENYRNKSFLMQADPYQIWTVTSTYYVKAEMSHSETDPADTVVYAYSSSVYNGLDPSRLSDIYGEIDIDYLGELIEVKADLDANCFTLNVKGLTADMAEKAFAYIDANMHKFSADNDNILPAHQLYQLTKYTSVITDSKLESEQVRMAGNIDRYISSQASSSQTVESLSAEISSPLPFRSVKKYVFFGFIVGGFLGICFYAVRYFLNNCLRQAEEISEAYTLPLYCEFPRSRACRPGKGIDGLLEKWEFGQKQLNSKASYDEIYSLLSEKHANKKILFTGTITEKDLMPFVEALQAKCGNICEISFQPDFLHNKSAIQACNNADSVILVEKKGVSSNKDIARMVDMLLICKSNVEGFVLL